MVSRSRRSALSGRAAWHRRNAGITFWKEAPQAVEMTGTESKSSGILGRIHALRRRHPRAESALFFAGGFLFDTLAVGRIDEAFTLLQMAGYLAVLATLMLMEERHRAGLFSPPRFLARPWRFAEDAIHFLFGTLLNVFTLFYLKSTSGLMSLLFLSFLGALLVVNEAPRFRGRGPMVRFALLSMCLTTYLALLLPVLLGFLSRWLFVAAVVLSCAALVALLRALPRGTTGAQSMGQRMAAPAFGMQALLVAAYFAGIIPPVPLSVQYMGIYHEVAIESQPEAPGAAAAAPGRTYLLKHQRPWWLPWRHGDQDFRAREGDVVHCFARIFAPNGFRDAIFVHWRVKGTNGRWEDQGRARLEISGGRENGFRADATKKNYRPGRWRVEIETEDGRDLGVIYFTLRDDPATDSRTFAVDRL
jgi:hypothetical protein